MALSIKSEKADELARELADLAGTTLTGAIVMALEEELKRRKSQTGVGDRLRELSRELAKYPVLDDRPADEILGYDYGLPN
ncbi:MAG TPA: type II toxin-antitoxin system VapB family antitoxin [Acidimicrobiia bacterium]